MRTLSSEFVDGRWFVFLSGDSDETKPTDNICDGSIFLESDTAAVSFFNETAGDWIPVGGGDEEE